MTREELLDHLQGHVVKVLQAVAHCLVYALGARIAEGGHTARVEMRDFTNLPPNTSQSASATVSTPLQESGSTPPHGHMIFVCKPPPYQPLSHQSLNTVGAYVCSTSASAPVLDHSSYTDEQQAMIELGLRLLILEDRNKPGTTVWKIAEIQQRLSDAVKGRGASMCGMPFYTSPQGYKICLQVYLNGDGIGKNSHMSLFFVIMKGEFDNILQWPFTHKVTFKLINQTGGRDIIDTFQPDPMSSSFRKPKSDMNIASGCPRFVSHTKLKSGDFIKDDTIFIKCTIEGEM